MEFSGDSGFINTVESNVENNICSDGDIMVVSNITNDEAQFDIVIGHIEDILVEDEFQAIQKTFLDKYWHEFESSEENKLIYMDIFNEYINVVEQFIETRLDQLMPNFSMNSFLRELIKQKESLDGEVFDMLYTFSDFSAFKEMFLDYKAMKEGVAVDFSEGITITALSLVD